MCHYLQKEKEKNHYYHVWLMIDKLNLMPEYENATEMIIHIFGLMMAEVYKQLK